MLVREANKLATAASPASRPRPASSQVVQRVGPRGRQPLVVLEPAVNVGLPEPPGAVEAGDGPPPVPRLATRSAPVRRPSSRGARTTDDGCGASGSAPEWGVMPVGRRRRRRRRRSGVAGEEQRGGPERQREQRHQQQELDAPRAHIRLVASPSRVTTDKTRAS